MNLNWQSSIKLASDLIQFPTVSSTSNHAISQFLAEKLERIGFDVELLSYQDNQDVLKTCVVAKRGTGTGGVAYLAHSDVVPADDWSLDFCQPFEPTVRDDKLYGRGACDMKGSLAAAMTAVAMTPQTNSPIYFVITSDEEVGMQGARCVDTQSHLFREMVAHQTVGIVGEPTRLDVIHAHKGGLRFEILSRGMSAHTSTNEGINANFALFEAIPAIMRLHRESETNPLYHNNAFAPPTLSWNMILKNEPRAVNVTPSLATLSSFIRTMPNVSPEPLLEQLQALCQQHQLELQRSEEVQPWGVPPQSEWIQTMLRLVGEPESKSVCYATDAGILQRLERLMICGPGDIQQAHRSDEFIELEQLQKGVEAYQKAFLAFANA